MGPIILSSTEGSTNSDILQGTRLQTVPAGGVMTFELQSNANSPSNNCAVSIQMPNGDTPLNSVRVPSSNPALEGAIDERQNLTVSFPIMQGGHCVFSSTETGNSVLSWRVTYTPA
ncbi:MAG: hypothetical protein GY776_21870 [Alteromonas sp.]|nr:hypothetical protein [Alteromonas sp.]